VEVVGTDVDDAVHDGRRRPYLVAGRLLPSELARLRVEGVDSLVVAAKDGDAGGDGRGEANLLLRVEAPCLGAGFGIETEESPAPGADVHLAPGHDGLGGRAANLPVPDHHEVRADPLFRQAGVGGVVGVTRPFVGGSGRAAQGKGQKRHKRRSQAYFSRSATASMSLCLALLNSAGSSV